MPYSSAVFDTAIQRFLTTIKPQRILDIGAGAGKLGSMVRAVTPTAHVVAVEIDPDYVTRFRLAETYDQVLQFNCMNLLSDAHLETTYDVVFFGDVIEHLRKSEGRDLLEFLIYRAAWILVQVPLRYVQNSVDGHASEAHISVWTPSDFSNYDIIVQRQLDNILLVAVRGYLNSSASPSEVKQQLMI